MCSIVGIQFSLFCTYSLVPIVMMGHRLWDAKRCSGIEKPRCITRLLFVLTDTTISSVRMFATVYLLSAIKFPLSIYYCIFLDCRGSVLLCGCEIAAAVNRPLTHCSHASKPLGTSLRNECLFWVVFFPFYGQFEAGDSSRYYCNVRSNVATVRGRGKLVSRRHKTPCNNRTMLRSTRECPFQTVHYFVRTRNLLNTLLKRTLTASLRVRE